MKMVPIPNVNTLSLNFSEKVLGYLQQSSIMKICIHMEEVKFQFS
jgi:hypothetical protein